ncbi:hypothetical protein NQZ68_030735 [Dissostichus eleginoides]|nr:hypothetical protein NQZ68_030735 [Dissostichus eleginoides]
MRAGFSKPLLKTAPRFFAPGVYCKTIGQEEGERNASEGRQGSQDGDRVGACRRMMIRYGVNSPKHRRFFFTLTFHGALIATDQMLHLEWPSADLRPAPAERSGSRQAQHGLP